MQAAGEYCDTDKERWRRLFAFIDQECQRVVARYGCHEEAAQRLRTTAKVRIPCSLFQRVFGG
jgi:hypothetical protein